MRDSGAIRAKAVYLGLGINRAGEKGLLGIWITQTEGAKFWLHVVTELKNRGVADSFIACVDGLKGFPEAIEAMFPKTAVQHCIVHQVRYNLNDVSWKLRKEVTADRRAIYTAATVQEAEQQLEAFEAKWGEAYPAISQSWRRNWPRIIAFFDYLPEIHKVIYPTGPTAQGITPMFDLYGHEHGIDHRMTNPKHPWATGQVERLNRTIKQAL